MGIVQTAGSVAGILVTIVIIVFGGFFIYTLAISRLGRGILIMGTLLVAVIWMIVTVLWLVARGVV